MSGPKFLFSLHTPASAEWPAARRTDDLVGSLGVEWHRLHCRVHPCWSAPSAILIGSGVPTRATVRSDIFTYEKPTASQFHLAHRTKKQAYVQLRTYADNVTLVTHIRPPLLLAGQRSISPAGRAHSSKVFCCGSVLGQTDRQTDGQKDGRTTDALTLLRIAYYTGSANNDVEMQLIHCNLYDHNHLMSAGISGLHADFSKLEIVCLSFRFIKT